MAACIAINGDGDLGLYAAALTKRITGVIAPEPAAALLQRNVTSLCVEAKGNRGRGGIVARVTAGLPTAQAAELAGCSTRTVQRARKDKEENPAWDAVWLQHPALERERVSKSEVAAVLAWIHVQCPVKSGSKYHMQYILSHELYDTYTVATGVLQWARKQERCKARCRSWFEAMKKKAKVRVARTFWGQFHCVRCKALEEEKRRTERLQVRLAALAPGESDEADAQRAELDVEVREAKLRLAKLQEH